jgi:mono/diheme cytochrome c family protein
MSALRALRPPAVIAAVIGLLIVLPGCQVKNSAGDAANGKRLFVQKCGSCHVLRRAGTQGVVGPNLDEAFQQDRRDGYPASSIRGVVREQILYPNRNGTMPGKLFEGQDATDVATYVAAVAGVPGKDTGTLANAVPTAQRKPAVAKGGKLEIDADPSGRLAFLAPSASAPTGALTITMQNKSSTPHNIGIKGQKVGPTVSGGKFSTINLTLKPGKYEFYCAVPGHEQGGMKGTLTVK